VYLLSFFLLVNLMNLEVSMIPDDFLPDAATLATLGELPDDAPVVMLNLLEFSDDGGEAYRRYGQIALPQIERRGGKILYSGMPVMDIAEAGHWDRVVIVYYPSRAVFLDMMADSDYQSGLVHRAAGLKRTVLYAFRPSIGPTALPVASVEGASGTAADDEIFVLNLLRYKANGGREEFGKYGQVVRPLIAELGGGPVLMLTAELPLVADEVWEDLILVRYPKLTALQEMVSSDVWQSANEDRLRGIDLTWSLPTKPAP
jgi:uncharacterized protein (DUF1330 family)